MAVDTTTTLADQRLTETLAAQFALLIGDRGANLSTHPSLIYQGDFTDLPALSKKCPIVGWGGYDALAAVSEGGTISLTNLTDTKVDLAVGKYGKGHGVTDYAALFSKNAMINDPAAASMDALKARDKTLCGLIAALSDDWTQDAGATGTAMTADKFYAAVGLIEAGYLPEGASYISQMTASHFREFAEDLRTETGVLHLLQSTADTQNIKTGNYRGSYAGVDIFASSQLVVAAGDTLSHMFGTGGVYWADARSRPGPAAIGIFVGNVFVEWQRTSATGQDDLFVQAWLGVAKAQDGCGVSITCAT